MKTQTIAMLFLMGAFLTACSDNNNDQAQDTVDMTQKDMSVDHAHHDDMSKTEDMTNSEDMAHNEDMGEDIEEDIPTFGDMGPDLGDERRTTLIKEWPLLDKKAPADSVMATEDNGTWTTTIDATAGGTMASRENAFVYLDLDEGKQLDITDLEALSDTRWELAFKRFIIRTNSGDSGDGGVELALIEQTSFDAVTSAPTDADAYVVDRTLDDDNMVLTDPIGTPYTAFNDLNKLNPSGSQSWYDYNMGLTPTPGDVYVLRGSDKGSTFKLEIDSWKSGIFVIRWRTLP